MNGLRLVAGPRRCAALPEQSKPCKFSQCYAVPRRCGRPGEIATLALNKRLKK